MDETISVRLPKEELKELDKLLTYVNATRSIILREVLNLGIREKMLEVALDKFQKNQATAAKAARIAGMSLSEFMQVLHEKGISFHYGVEELREDFQRLIEDDN